jgi:LytS/YehU family sensor histidine kinase
VLDIEDNAGLYQPSASGGLGMSLVDKRLRAHFGDDCGITVACEPTDLPVLPYDCRWRKTHVKSADCG